jgi:hypothetical protein
MIRFDSIKFKVPDKPGKPKIVEIKIGSLIEVEILYLDKKPFLLKGKVKYVDIVRQILKLDISKEYESNIEDIDFHHINKLNVVEE